MLKGQGVLSLWNGVAAERRAEYDLWHTREHVPERLAIPGMLRARRYDRGSGPLPEFLTLYELDDTRVLDSAPYRTLLETPTPWSRSMRPSFRGFFRVGQRIVLSRGGGMGRAMMATTCATPSGDRGGWESVAGELLSRGAATAIHVLEKDPHVAPVPFAVPPAGAAFADGGAIMVESHDRGRLAEIAEVLSPLLDARDLAPGRDAWTGYDLAYVLDRDELPVTVALSGGGDQGSAPPANGAHREE